MDRTQRWEAHIWQEGKQIYLGGFDAEEQAALAYDLAALKFRGPDAHINFDISNYEQELLHFNDVSTSSFTGFPIPASLQGHTSLQGYQGTHRLCSPYVAKATFQQGICAHMGQVTEEEVVQNLRRQSKGYQKTSSQYRGVTRHQKGKWEARIGQMVGKKYKCEHASSAPVIMFRYTPCHGLHTLA